MFSEKGFGGLYELGGQDEPAVINVEVEDDDDAPDAIPPPDEDE